jgi:hypothetical protein
MMTKEEMAKIIADSQRQVDEQRHAHNAATRRFNQEMGEIQITAMKALIQMQADVAMALARSAKPVRRITVAM